MKIRQGFVANSSSSSFLIYGAHVDLDEFYGEDERPDNFCIAEDIENKIFKLKLHNLEYHEAYQNSSEYCVGVSPEDFDDNKTMAKNKKDVEKAVKKLLGKNAECDWISGESGC